jgi:hypothetical protein
MLAFPLGGVGTGGLALYGRGQLRDNVFNTRSLRKSAFGDNMYGNGAMGLRQLLPAGKELHKLIATDGQMGRSSTLIWTGSL